MSLEIVVREYEGSDFDSVMNIAQEAFSGLGKQEKKEVMMSYRYSYLPDTGKNKFYLAYSKDKMIGFAFYSTGNDPKEGVLEQIYVSQEFRKQGVSKKIYYALEKGAVSSGITHMSAFVESCNRPSINMMKNLSYRPSLQGDQFIFEKDISN